MSKDDLKAWRLVLALDQGAMARYVGVPFHTWRNWESGARRPTGPGLALITLIQDTETRAPDFAADRIHEARTGAPIESVESSATAPAWLGA